MGELQPGTILKARFQIERRLGAGGMGEVYVGQDLQEHQLVAVKLIRNDLQNSSNEIFLRRFREEVEMLRRLSFPGVPGFVDAFEMPEGQSVLVMEFIEGHSLIQLLHRAKAEGARGLRLQLVVQVGIQVCRILEYLHAHKPPVVHRDIKPDNIIIRTSDESVFLVDFGLAREIHSNSSMKTMIGTASYAPMEQFQGKPEARSDLYSLGITMLELLSGSAPAPLTVPPVKEILPGLHEDLARILSRSTRTLAEERYPNAGDMRLLLEDVLPRLEEIRPIAPAPVDPNDKIIELIHRWGHGKQSAPAPPPPPQLLAEPLLGDDPVLRRNVQRAAFRAQMLHGQRTMSPFLRTLILLLLAAGGAYALHRWNERQETRPEPRTPEPRRTRKATPRPGKSQSFRHSPLVDNQICGISLGRVFLDFMEER